MTSVSATLNHNPKKNVNNLNPQPSTSVHAKLNCSWPTLADMWRSKSRRHFLDVAVLLHVGLHTHRKLTRDPNFRPPD